MENKELDKDLKAFFEKEDVTSLDVCIREFRTCYIDLIADGQPNLLIYKVFLSKQDTEEKQDLARHYRQLFEEMLNLYNKLYKQKENGGRSFDKNNLVIATTLKDALINSFILSQTKDNKATKIDANSKLYVDKKDLTLERLATQNDFIGSSSVFSMFNALYLEYGQALADLMIFKIIGQALKVEILNQDEIINYWNCATYEDLTAIIDKCLEVLKNIYKDNEEYKKSNFYIDLVTTKAINYKISVLLDTDTDQENFNNIARDIERLILKENNDTSLEELKKPHITPRSLDPNDLTTRFRRFLTSYYWNRIKDEIRGVAESEGSYDKK